MSIITRPSFAHIHDEMRTQLLNKVLPSLFPTFVNELKPLGAYPVILGGTLVQRCAKRSVDSYQFIRNLLTEDIDIKVVVTSEDVDSIEHPIIKTLHTLRRTFVDRVKEKLAPTIKKLKNTYLDIRLDLNQELLEKRNVFSVNVTYVEFEDTDTVRSTTLPLMDLGVFVKYSIPHYYKYRKLYPNVKLPIPYVKFRGVYYATCDFAYFDTVRMMIDRLKYFQSKRTMFGLMKFSRYVLKFMCLHVLLNEGKIKVDGQIEQIYDRVRRILQTIDVAKMQMQDAMTLQYNEQYVTEIIRILSVVVHATHIEDLVAFMESSVPHSQKLQLLAAVGGGKAKRVELHKTILQLQRVLQTPKTVPTPRR